MPSRERIDLRQSCCHGGACGRPINRCCWLCRARVGFEVALVRVRKSIIASQEVQGAASALELKAGSKKNGRLKIVFHHQASLLIPYLVKFPSFDNTAKMPSFPQPLLCVCESSGQVLFCSVILWDLKTIYYIQTLGFRGCK